jgi:hypothetical protein
MERGEKAVRRSHTQTPAQRASQYLAMPLEEHVAFLKQEELTLDDLLKRLPIPNRPYAQVPPRLPPYFGTLDRERRARMIEECARPGANCKGEFNKSGSRFLLRLRRRRTFRKKSLGKKWGQQSKLDFMTLPRPWKNFALVAVKSSSFVFRTAET